MKIIKVSSGSAELSNLLLRQSPEGKGIWGDCQFIVNKPLERCDWWVVLHGSGLRLTEKTLCDPDHIIYISMEPNESVGNISKKFLEQFSQLIICDRKVAHYNITYANGFTWWVGMNLRHQHGHHHFSAEYALDYDQLTTMHRPEKKNRISVIVSKKNFLEGHIKRLNFLEKIQKSSVANYIDIFGGGFNPILDKWDAIASYRYHLVLENDITPDYWSEKLADAFLGFSYPIYFGCPNIQDYFDSDSLLTINIEDFDKTVAILNDLISTDLYEKHVESIIRARDKVLNQYNIFQLMASICDQYASRYIQCRLNPNSYYTDPVLKNMVKNVFYKNQLLMSLYRKLYNA